MLYQLAAEAGRDPKTVQAVLDGEGNDQSRAAVLAAARRLGLGEPILATLSQVTPTRFRA